MVSIIIVHYRVKKELFECINSIIKSGSKIRYEILVVDNDEEKNIKKDLLKNFPKVTYIPNKNKGFGQGNNIGAMHAKGEFLFFLNPDATIYPKCIDTLINYLEKHKQVAIAAPLLFDDKNNPLALQGGMELKPINALFVSSFLSTLFPNNSIARKYWMLDSWDKLSPHEVASVPGTAFVIRKEVFKKVDGFDERFFLYFEEHDLCKRVESLGWKLVMLPRAKVFHTLGSSTKKSSRNMKKIFNESRFYYFKKHFGVITAIVTESVLRFNKYSACLLIILLIAAFVSSFKITSLMSFISDQAWFYMSARDSLTGENIPLVGIASSHPWLHQGALWTYMLIPVLLLFQFNPIGGAYLSILLFLMTILFLFKTCSDIFSQRTGIIAALFYATSPLIILSARMPYHTSPIPLFTLIYFYSMYQWVNRKGKYFPLIIFSLAILYNLEIATFLLTAMFLCIFVFGVWKKKIWIKTILNKNILAISFISFILPMSSMILYDMGHGFPQTIKFFAWIVYKVLVAFGYPQIHPEIKSPHIVDVVHFLGASYQQLTYVPSTAVSFILGILSIGLLGYRVTRQLKAKKYDVSSLLLGLIVFVSVLGIIATKTISGAYLPILFPLVTIVTAIFFDTLLTIRKTSKYFIWTVIFLIAFMNAYAIINDNYFVPKGHTFADQLTVARKVVTQANGRGYNLIGNADKQQNENLVVNYQYLTWWLGNGPSNMPQKLTFQINEQANGIIVKTIQQNTKKNR